MNYSKINSEKGFAPILLIVVILGITAIVVGAFYFSKLSTPKPQATVTQQTATPTSQSQSVTTGSLDDLISYTIPTGWKKIVMDSTNISINSPDYEAGENPMLIKSGMSIGISQYKANPGDSVDALASSLKNTAGVKEVTQTTLVGQAAVHYQVAYEGFYDKYILFKDGNEWLINIQLPGNSAGQALRLEDNYKSQINQFLQSLAFKSNSITDTSSWKTYINKEYGYSIKYPNTWSTQPTSSVGIILNSSDFASHPTSGAIEKGASIIIWPNKNPPTSSLDFSILSKKQVKVNNLEATMFEVTGAGINGKAKIMSIKQGNIYTDIEFYYDPSREKEFSTIFNQMLATFKFTQ